MIFPENRFPLFGIMLCPTILPPAGTQDNSAVHYYPLDGSRRPMREQRAFPAGGKAMTVSTTSTETSFVDRCAASCHDIIALVGRVVISGIFLSSGFAKLNDVAAFSGMLAKRGVPAPSLMGWLGAIVEFGGGVLILLGIKLRYAAILMILFVIVATLISHRYWEYPVDQIVAQRTNFWKNITIIGGLLFMFLAGAGRYSVDGYKKQ
jgi:putative oxidoreductase